MTTQDTSPADAIIQVLQRLNIQRAHFAAFGSDPEWQGLASQHRDRIASMSVVTPGPFPAQAVASLGPRLLAVFGDQGPQPGQAQTMADLLPAAKFAQLKDYRVLIWSDVARERTSELTSALLGHVKHAQSQQDGTATVCSQATELRGELGGVRYHVQGQGPALVLLPLGLSHSQWEPMLPALREKFCTIVLRGPMLGSAAFLEERGRQPGYLRVVGNVIDAMQIRPEESVLEVGSGSGVLARWLAQRTRGQNPIVGVDINRYLLDEAMALVQTDGLAGQVRFQEGNAEALPFPDAGFDIVWSCTVMEEANADRMLAEMIRVAKPGGRVAVIVRAEDMPLWVNLPVPAEIRARAESAHIARGESGCDDASLYKRFAASGLANLQMFPQIGATGNNPERAILSNLTPEEAAVWRVAAQQARSEGTFMLVRAFHCAVGTKPA